ncbi:lysylphosphatidylglycerol synthase domain-containing protein, partial [Salmonella enterica]
ILIGYLLKEPVHLTEVFPIFVIASIVGIVSMVPGGVGTFDIFMIYGLGQIGVSKELAVIWLLFYRIFYYIIPFFIGILFFVHDGGSKINQY